ncbi:MAG: glycosyltransferase family 4 protein [Flavobacteriaceae bacterium]|nr:glycosyltransferase family 4 protein [Flavobacteriaceae bacterium]
MLSKAKPILIITYYWPPSGGSGVQRWLYFSKYLKKLGYSPIVLSIDVKSASFSSIDKSLLKEVEGIPIHYVKAFNWIKIYSWFRNGFKSSIKVPQGEFSKKGISDYIASFIRGNLFIPDARISWIKPAIRKAIKIINDNNIDQIITSGPPHSTHLIGLKLKSILKTKWIADFRDPWTDLFYLKSFYRLSFAKKKDSLLEKKVLSNADAILTTASENFHKELQSKISVKKRFYKIYNGFDADLFNNFNKEINEDFKIVFTGLLTSNHPYKSVIESLIKLKKLYSNIKFKIVFAGLISDEILEEFELIPNFKYYGYLDHSKAVDLMCQANILLNFLFDQNKKSSMISGKLIEYMATGNPILMIGDSEGEASKLLSKQSYNLTVKPTEIDLIISFIKTIYDNWVKGKIYEAELSPVLPFSREENTKSLIKIIEGL